MNWLDYVIIGITGAGAVFGILSGPLWQAYRICSIILAGVAAFFLNGPVNSILNIPEMSNLTGYVIVFAIVIILSYVIGTFFQSFLTKKKFKFRGRIIGGGFGFIITLLACCVIISSVSFFGNQEVKQIINDSIIAYNLDKGTKAVISRVPEDIKSEGHKREKNDKTISNVERKKSNVENDKIIHERI